MLDTTIDDLKRELEGARAKFPESKHQMAALTEEVGELAQALLDHLYGKATAAMVYREAIQVAAMGIRVAEEGDTTFPYRFSEQCQLEFKPTTGN